MLIYFVFSLTLSARLLFCNLVCLNKWTLQIGHYACHLPSELLQFVRNISNQKLVYIISYFIDVEIKGINTEHDRQFCFCYYPSGNKH